MTRLFAVLFTLALAASASAQIVQPTQSISVQDSGTQCATAGTCASWPLLNTSPGFIVQITGTFSGTLTFRGSADNTTFFDILATKVSTGAAATTTTTTGQYTITNSGLLTLRIVGTTIMSGGANITLTRGPGASARSGSGATFNSLATGDVLYASGTNVVSGLADVAVGQLFASGGVGVAPAYTASPSITGTYTQTLTALATTSTDGILGSNGTAATVGATVQISPRIKLTANGWDADDTVSRPVRFFTEAISTGTNTVAGNYKIGYMDPITSALTYPIVITSIGQLTALSTLSFGDNLQRGSSIVYGGANATIASGFSTTTPSIVGRGSSFAVTIAATPGVTGTVNFNSTFASVPNTSCTNTVTANAVQAVPTTTQVVLNGVWIANDVIRCITLGY